ncbi:Hypothetical_protein [Hexamita inflata]|uniref:Hypothetical_protein n=1 Tax=Hexamita inflata TaxID=28002 RepID=A0ABP1HW19_9EUKA
MAIYLKYTESLTGRKLQKRGGQAGGQREVLSGLLFVLVAHRLKPLRSQLVRRAVGRRNRDALIIQQQLVLAASLFELSLQLLQLVGHAKVGRHIEAVVAETVIGFVCRKLTFGFQKYCLYPVFQFETNLYSTILLEQASSQRNIHKILV